MARERKSGAKHYRTIGQYAPMHGECALDNLPFKRGDKVVVPKGTIVRTDKGGDFSAPKTYQVRVARILNGSSEGGTIVNPRVFWGGISNSRPSQSADINDLALPGDFLKNESLQTPHKERVLTAKGPEALKSATAAPALDAEPHEQSVHVQHPPYDTFADLAVQDHFIVFPLPIEEGSLQFGSRRDYWLLQKLSSDSLGNAKRVADGVSLDVPLALPVVKITATK